MGTSLVILVCLMPIAIAFDITRIDFIDAEVSWYPGVTDMRPTEFYEPGKARPVVPVRAQFCSQYLVEDESSEYTLIQCRGPYSSDADASTTIVCQIPWLNENVTDAHATPEERGDWTRSSVGEAMGFIGLCTRLEQWYTHTGLPSSPGFTWPTDEFQTCETTPETVQYNPQIRYRCVTTLQAKMGGTIEYQRTCGYITVGRFREVCWQNELLVRDDGSDLGYGYENGWKFDRCKVYECSYSCLYPYTNRLDFDPKGIYFCSLDNSMFIPSDLFGPTDSSSLGWDYIGLEHVTAASSFRCSPNSRDAQCAVDVKKHRACFGPGEIAKAFHEGTFEPCDEGDEGCFYDCYCKPSGCENHAICNGEGVLYEREISPGVHERTCRCSDGVGNKCGTKRPPYKCNHAQQKLNDVIENVTRTF